MGPAGRSGRPQPQPTGLYDSLMRTHAETNGALTPTSSTSQAFDQDWRRHV